MNYNLPGSSVHGISQARILEWVAISFSRGSSWPRDRTCVFCLARLILYQWPHILCNTCGLGSVFLGYPCNFPMVFSIWALQLETGQLRVTEAHDLSEVLTPLCQLFRKVYFILSPKLVSLYLLLFCSCSQEEWDGGSSLSPSGPALWSPLTLPNILFSCSWFLQINFMALWFPVFSVSVRVPTGNTGTN